MQLKYWLADADDRNRLADDGTVQPAHQCTPQYFDTADEAYHHPMGQSLKIYKCPKSETIPGMPVGVEV